jgi:Protein of unknown function (DUF2637)
MKQATADRWAAIGGYVWLTFVGACVAAMSWTGLVGFARDNLGLGEPLAYVVPVSLDGAAITLGFFALRSVLAGEAAGFPRLLAVVVVVASSAFNVYHAETTGRGSAAAVFFGGMSVLVYLMFEVVLRQLRRRHLRGVGAVEEPLPRFRFARWARYPRLTFRAWSAAVLHSLTDPREAMAVSLERPNAAGLEAPEVELRETRTVERSITARPARNGTKAARIRELADEGLDQASIVEATGFSADTVRMTLARRKDGGS